MTTVNYPSPVTVNGYACKNCTDVDYAKKNIDPSHPKDGPFGVNKTDHPKPTAAVHKTQDSAVTFAGALAGVSQGSGAGSAPSATQGLRLNISI